MPPEKNIKVRPPAGKVRRNIDYGEELYSLLDEISEELNISTQAIAKMAIQDWVDRHYLAKAARKKSTKKKAG